MQRFIRYTVITMVILAGFTPALAAAQTSVAATPQAGPAIQVEILADTASLMMADDIGTPEPVAPATEHRLVRITMQPGTAFHTGSVMQSALVYIESGSITLSTVDTPASVSVGSGQPIVAASDDRVACEQDVCIAEPGESVVLSAGNGFALAEDAMNVATTGNDEAVFVLSAVFMANNHQLCWICPTF